MTDARAMQDELAARMSAAFSSIVDGNGDPVEVRESLKASRRTPIPVPVGGIEERSIPVGGDESVRVRIYYPSEPEKSADGVPVLVYFHGGGFVLCDLDSHDSCCRRSANGVGAVVVSVDYRLVPESPFPAAVEDVWAATEWVASHLGELGGDPARLLHAAGVPVTVQRYDRMFHGFFNLADHLPIAEQATNDVCAVLRHALRGEPQCS